MNRTKVTVTGMACDGCERTVESALEALDGVARVDADHQGDAVDVVAEDGVADADLHRAIEDAGYDVEA